jgi:hypothetical protein
LFDVFAHCMVAYVLPGPFWYQWLPDVCVPVLVVLSLLSGVFVAADSVVVGTHRVLHSGSVVLVIVALSGFYPVVLPLAVHWAVHLCIDLETHQL